MYNILITDDEQIVIDSLTMILSRNFGDKVQIYSALSGSMALELVHSVKIDIVFMDVHMPGINGLETISLIKQVNPNAVIIILSAYDQFQYAQEALNLGAYKYLTKPVNRNLIVQTVQNAMAMVDSQRLKFTDSIRMHEKLNLVSSMVESDFIYSCIFNNKNTDFNDYMSYFGITNDSYCMCCIEVPLTQKKNRADVYEKIRDILVSKSRCIVGSFMENRICAFFPLAKNTIFSDELSNSDTDVVELFKGIYSLLSIKIDSGIRIGVSEVETKIDNTQICYTNSLSALSRTDTKGGLEFFNRQEPKLKDTSKVQKLKARLLARVKAGDAPSVRLLSTEYIVLLFNIYEENQDRIRNCLFETMIDLKNVMAAAVSKCDNTAFDNIYGAVSDLLTQTDYEKYFAARCSECVVAIGCKASEVQNPVIKKACEYIESHLSDDIDLDCISREIGVSPYYLSKLFKEVKNENYINYLNSLRLEKAKKLLEDDSLIIKEVTASVGYNDQNYFSKLFKQKYGLTPTEYRESYKSGNV